MTIPWEAIAYIEKFFQLNFLFSGLEVSSSAVFAARAGTLLVFGAGFAWVTFRIVMKGLDCLQTFLAGIGPLPRSFFLLLLFVIPLSSDSLGTRWMGYFLAVMALFGLSACGVMVLVLWKYGVDQALRLVNTLTSRVERSRPDPGGATAWCSDNCTSDGRATSTVPQPDPSPRLV